MYPVSLCRCDTFPDATTTYSISQHKNTEHNACCIHVVRLTQDEQHDRRVLVEQLTYVNNCINGMQFNVVVILYTFAGNAQ